jgi:hypothetical protein
VGVAPVGTVTIWSPGDEQVRDLRSSKDRRGSAITTGNDADSILSALSASRSGFDLFGQPQAHRAASRHLSNVPQAFSYLECLSVVKIMLTELSAHSSYPS